MSHREPSSALDEYLGYYELQPGIIFHVTKKDERLYVQLTGQPSYPVYASSRTEFYYKVVDAQLTFVAGSDGSVTSLILHQGGRDQTATKLGPDYTPPGPRSKVDVDPAVLERYVGNYEIQPGVIATVTTDSGRLMVQISGQPRLEVFPESPTKFFYTAVEAQITFVSDDNGPAKALILHQGGLDHEAKRIE